MSRLCKLTCLDLIILAVAAACNTSKKSPDTSTATPAAVVVADTSAGVAVAVPVDPGVELDVAASPEVAVFLVDSKGRAIYTLDNASGGNATPTGNCATNFTPIAGHSTASGDTSVKSSMTGSIARPDGSRQATYNGKPLYYYNGDKTRGDTKGKGLKEDCGTAHLVNPGGNSVFPPKPGKK
jgi:predicted lipoprotein with Yx(FWY)xxD motif